MNKDGSENKRLTSEDEIVTDAIFSPDGKRIYLIKAKEFYAAHSGVAAGLHAYDLFSMNVDGTDEQRLTSFSSEWMSDLSITADGEKLGMIMIPYNGNKKVIKIEGSSKGTDFIIYDINTKELLAYGETNLFSNATLSPNGKKVAYSESGQEPYELVERDILSGIKRQITNLQSYAEHPIYLNENTLYFIYDRNNKDGSYEEEIVAKINSDGSGFMEVLNFNNIMK
ncbi:TolB family protein [Bacillus sp. CGMCC 1.16607]|uniref:TolB family protein n=1 Tax=Bacillus sp. CGMCC 1.16607 TaxID=3351842 RepID=UPI0036420E27